MTKSQLLDSLARRLPMMRDADIESSVKSILKHMVNALENGDRIEIRGFGGFGVHQRQPMIGRNPKTGDLVNLPVRTVAHFKPGKQMRDRVNVGRQKCDIE